VCLGACSSLPLRNNAPRLWIAGAGIRAALHAAITTTAARICDEKTFVPTVDLFADMGDDALAAVECWLLRRTVASWSSISLSAPKQMRRTPPRPKQRPRFALPFGINLADYDFQPTREEKLLDRVNEMKLVWDREDDDRRRRRSALIAKEIAEEKRKQEIEDRREEIAREREAEIERRRNYYLAARKAEGPMEKLIERYQNELEGNWYTKALRKLEKLTAEIRHDRLKAEREALTRRGVLRGRR
jgi:hypothetical protein